VTTQDRTALIVIGALRDDGDPGRAQLVERGEHRWVTPRTIEVVGVHYTAADCGCVLTWRPVSGALPAHGRVLKDCHGAAGHLPHDATVGAEALEATQP